MKNLTKKLIPLVLVGAGIIGCATQPPAKILTEPVKPAQIVSPSEKNDRWIDLKNGFSAESYLVMDNILLLTEVFLGESILKKTEEGYKGINTLTYHTTPTEVFDRTYDEFCEAVDNGDKFLTEMETEHFLDRLYDSMYRVDWVEDEE